MQSSRVSKFMLGLLFLGLSVLTIYIIGVVIIIQNCSICKISEERPWPNLLHRRSVASPNNSALVDLDAYLRYSSPTGGGDLYAPLTLRNVTTKRLIGGKSTELVLHTDCAKLVFDLIESPGRLILKQIAVDLTYLLGSNQGCLIRFPYQTIWNYVTNHYSCEAEQSFSCHDDNLDCPLRANRSRPVAELVLYKLEYEFGGEVWRVKEALFTKPAQLCEMNEEETNVIS